MQWWSFFTKCPVTFFKIPNSVLTLHPAGPCRNCYPNPSSFESPYCPLRKSRASNPVGHRFKTIHLGMLVCLCQADPSDRKQWRSLQCPQRQYPQFIRRKDTISEATSSHQRMHHLFFRPLCCSEGSRESMTYRSGLISGFNMRHSKPDVLKWACRIYK